MAIKKWLNHNRKLAKILIKQRKIKQRKIKQRKIKQRKIKQRKIKNFFGSIKLNII